MAVTAVGVLLVSVPLFQEVNASYLKSLENLREPPDLPPPENPPPVNISVPIPPEAAALFCADSPSDEVEYPAANVTSDDAGAPSRSVDVPDLAVGGRLEAGWRDTTAFVARVTDSGSASLAEVQQQPQPSQGRDALTGQGNDTFPDVSGRITLQVDPGTSFPPNAAVTPRWAAILWLKFRCSEVV